MGSSGRQPGSDSTVKSSKVLGRDYTDTTAEIHGGVHTICYPLKFTSIMLASRYCQSPIQLYAWERAEGSMKSLHTAGSEIII